MNSRRTDWLCVLAWLFIVFVALAFSYLAVLGVEAIA